MYEITSFKIIKGNDIAILAEITRNDIETKVGWLFNSKVKISETLQVIKQVGYPFWYEVASGNVIYGVEAVYGAYKLMKHKDLIIKWANGAKIELFSVLEDKWVLVSKPYWVDEVKYREYIPARTAFEEGKKVLARYKNVWIRLTSAEYFILDWDVEFIILEPDTNWEAKFNKGAKLEFQSYNSTKWVKVTDKFSWKCNSAYKFREVN